MKQLFFGILILFVYKNSSGQLYLDSIVKNKSIIAKEYLYFKNQVCNIQVFNTVCNSSTIDSLTDIRLSILLRSLSARSHINVKKGLVNLYSIDLVTRLDSGETQLGILEIVYNKPSLAKKCFDNFNLKRKTRTSYEKIMRRFKLFLFNNKILVVHSQSYGNPVIQKFFNEYKPQNQLFSASRLN